MKPTKYQRCRVEGRCFRCHKKKDGPQVYCEPCKQIRKERAIFGKPSGIVAFRMQARDIIRSIICELEFKRQMDGLGSGITNDIRRWESWLKEALELLTRKKTPK